MQFNKLWAIFKVYLELGKKIYLEIDKKKEDDMSRSHRPPENILTSAGFT